MAMQIRNAQGEALDVAYDAGSPLVVIGHGVTANKDRDWALTLHRALVDAGFGALRFSFSGNGASEGDFRESTVSKEVADLIAVLDALEAAGVPEVDYAGHSMGGAVGVLAASQDRRIGKLISLAGMVHTHDFADRKFGELEPGRDVMWEKPECPLSQAFVDDLSGIGDVLAQAAGVDVPWLLVHGTDDTVVPLRDSHDAREAAGGRPDLVELPGADHVFTGDATEAMTRAVVAWYLERRASL